MGTDRVYWDDRKTQEEILKVKDFLDTYAEKKSQA